MSLLNLKNDDVGIILEKAEGQSRIGNYYDAIKILEGFSSNPVKDSTTPWFGLVYASIARNKLHLQENQEALHYLLKIPHDILNANPKIAAEYHTIAGILERRDSYKKWKAGDTDAALAKANKAIVSFQLAEQASRTGLEDRLRHNAILNNLYAQGLHLAIQKKSKEGNASLLVNAIVAEAGSRSYTPPIFKNNLTGLTIIADLALGANISLEKIASLTPTPEYQAACRTIIGHHRMMYWADLLLHEVKYSTGVIPDVRAHALLLGSKYLLGDGRQYPENLLLAYAINLRLCYLDLKKSSINKISMLEIQKIFYRFPDDIQKQAMRTYFR